MAIVDSWGFRSGNYSGLDEKMRNWELPGWFGEQSNPLGPNFTISSEFKNIACRSWTVLRPDCSSQFFNLDQLGVLSMPQGHSLEVWVYDHGQLYNGLKYQQIIQRCRPDKLGVETLIRTKTIEASFKYTQIQNSNMLNWEFKILNVAGKSLRPIYVLLVIRPFGNEGFSPICRLEYKDRVLWVNRRKIVVAKIDPSLSYFCNEMTNDVISFFKKGNGNSGSVSKNGMCTGFLGYFGLPRELDGISVNIGSGKLLLDLNGLYRSRKIGCNEKKRLFKEVHLVTGTMLDQFYPIGIQHLESFSPMAAPTSVDLHQILILNRLALFDNSRNLLKSCLKRVQINGNLKDTFVGSEKIIYAVADYYRYSRDLKFIKEIWPILVRVAFCLIQSRKYSLSNGIMGGFWKYASLRELMEIAEILQRVAEVAILKSYYQVMYQKLLRRVSAKLRLEDDHLNQLSAREMVDLLGWVTYPGIKTELNIDYWLNMINNKFLVKGGVYDPSEFKGIDLELTVKLCQNSLWAGQNYAEILVFLLSAGKTTWSWPDRINPVTLKGIGLNGHEPKVLYHMLLLWRSIFINEVEKDLYIFPGIFNCSFWERPQIEIRKLFTCFGNVSLICKTVGDFCQINIESSFRERPGKIKLKLNSSYQLVCAEPHMTYQDFTVEASPETRIIRLKKCTI